MRKYLLLFIVYFFSACVLPHVSAQTILYADEQKFSFRKNQFNILGRVKGENFVYRTDNSKHFLDIYTDSLQKKAIVALDFLPDEVDQIKFGIAGYQITVVYQYHEGKIARLEAARLGLDGRMMQPAVVLDSTYDSGNMLARNKQNYDFEFSPNKLKFFAYKRTLFSKREYIHCLLVNDALEVEHTKDIVIDGGNAIYPQQFVLNDDGVLFFSSYLFSNEHDRKNDFATIYTVNFKDDVLMQHAIPMDGLLVDQMYIKLNQRSQSIDYAAFYSKSKKGGNEGILYGTLSNNENIAPQHKTIPFSEDFLLKLSAKRNKKTLENLDIKHVVIKNDGGILLVAENYFTTTRNSMVNTGMYSSYYGMGGGRVITEYNYGDIIVMNIAADGAIVWENLIHKNQVTQDDYGMFSSYGFANTGKYLVFVYNDFTSKKNVLTVASIDINGSILYSHIKVEDAKYDWVPKHSMQTSALSMLFPCFSKGAIIFAGIYF
jgi:hypothetical protein